jgi:hypothetical protein
MARTGQCYLWVPASFEYGMLVSHRWYLYERNDITMHVQVKDPRNIPTYFLDYPVNFFYPTGTEYDFERWYHNMQRQTRSLIKSAAGKQITIIDRDEGLTYPHNRIHVDMRRVPNCADWCIHGIEAGSGLNIDQCQLEPSSHITIPYGSNSYAYTWYSDWSSYPSAQGNTYHNHTLYDPHISYHQPTHMDNSVSVDKATVGFEVHSHSGQGESSETNSKIDGTYNGLPSRPSSAPASLPRESSTLGLSCEI